MKKLLLAFLFPGVLGATTTLVQTGSGGLIPDGSLTGFTDSVTFSNPTELIVDIQVSLRLSPTSGGVGYLGDLYLYLTDGTTLVTLMNRPGQDPSLLGGYADNQPVNIVFTLAATEDIHTYRESVTGDASTPLSGPLTGEFEADGRTTDPATVATSDSRDSALSDYVGLTGDRTFTLFAADLSSGGTHQIDSWAITLVVPEPRSLLLGLLGLGAAFVRRRS